MDIELLWFDGCPNHEAARQLLREVVEARQLQPTMRDVAVGSDDIAERSRFPGSPTIRVNGTDVDPAFVDDGNYSLRCRVYATPLGFRGVPERAWIESAIDMAVESERRNRAGGTRRPEDESLG